MATSTILQQVVAVKEDADRPMAMIECPECGRMVSDQANTCPECAYPVGGRSSTHFEVQAPATSSGARRGSAGNVVAGVASFFIPGLGQLVQGRVGRAIFHFVAAGVLWVVTFGWLGWIMHAVSAVNAARWQPDG